MAEYVDLISMNLNDSNLKPNEGGFQTIDPGTYCFEIDKQSVGQSAAGNNVLKITGKVVGPEGNPMMGRTMMNSYIIKPDDDFARGRMLNFLQASEAQIDEEGRFSREALVGLQFVADVEKRAGKSVDKMGKETERDFTSWVRERSINAADTVAATAPAQTATKPPAAATNGSAPRRPSPPAASGNGAQRAR